MADEKEQLPVTAEGTESSSDTENADPSTEAQPVSDDTEAKEAVAAEGAEEPKEVPLEETPVYKRKVQSEADKRMKPFEAKLKEKDAALESEKTARQKAEDAVAWHRRQLSEAKLWTQNGDDDGNEIPADKVRSFHQAEDALKKAWGEYTGIAPQIAEATNHRAAVDAVTEVIGADNLGKITLSEFNEIRDAFKECESDKERAVVAKFVKKDIKAKYAALIETTADKPKPTPKAPTRKPDGGASTVQGGKPSFTIAQVGDRAFYEAHREEILLAEKEGRIK